MTIPVKPPPNEESGTPYYIVAVRLKPDPVRKFNRSYDWTWLAIDSGYASHSSDHQRAYRFSAPPSLETIHSYSGMPWYDQHDKRYAPKVYKIWEYFKKEVALVT